MLKTNAQRQRAYRQRHLKEFDDDVEMLERINMMAHHGAKTGLKRLAHYYGVTQRALLEQIIDEATNRVLSTLASAQQADFYGMKITLRSNEGGGSATTSHGLLNLTDRDRPE
ncbi:hypothetical protein CKO15_13665 [Halorhodospira abdelmalekii]|uniref:hypothetical protein n=1 Tax=Halorhodospira abdelmalekii TaxID=421629 RepID=UPI001906D6D0|nr:hypothetical protein [Halorhodospira abdelmalekii]MBK1736288.1 hypothetical protein [Halorhodospira abdelmalekii]